MSEPMTDARLIQLESFVEHDQMHIGGDCVEAYELGEACEEIRRLREEKERLDKELDVLQEITDDFDDKLYAALQWKKQALKLLGEVLTCDDRWDGPALRDKIRAFLDGEDK